MVVDGWRLIARDCKLQFDGSFEDHRQSEWTDLVIFVIFDRLLEGPEIIANKQFNVDDGTLIARDVSLFIYNSHHWTAKEPQSKCALIKGDFSQKCSEA